MLGKDITNLVIVKMEEYSPYGPSSGSTLLAGGDRLNEVKPVYSYIAQHLAEAANEMLMIAPIHRLTYKDAGMGAVVNNEDKKTGYIPIPADFLRLHTLRMGGWTLPLHSITHEDNPAYSLQFCQWTRGTRQKPVVIMDGGGSTFPLKDADVKIIPAEEFTSAYAAWEANCMESGEWPDKYWQTTPDGTIHKASYDKDKEEAVTAEYTTARLQYFSVPENNTHTVETFYYIPKFSEESDYDRSIAELIALHCARKVYEVYGNTEQVGMMTSEINSVLENLRQ